MGKMRDYLIEMTDVEIRPDDAPPPLVWEIGDSGCDFKADSTRRIPHGCTGAYYVLGPTDTGFSVELVAVDRGDKVDAESMKIYSGPTARDAKGWAQQFEDAGKDKPPVSVLDLADDEISDEARVTFPPGLDVHMRRRVGKGGRIERVVEVCTDGLPDDMPLVVIVDGQEERRWYG